MLFSVHKRLGIAPNIEHQVIKVPAFLPCFPSPRVGSFRENGSHKLFQKERQQRKRSFDAAVCIVAAKLVRIAFAMLRDNAHFDSTQAF
jgi:hypothetical protein